MLPDVMLCYVLLWCEPVMLDGNPTKAMQSWLGVNFTGDGDYR